MITPPTTRWGPPRLAVLTLVLALLAGACTSSLGEEPDDDAMPLTVLMADDWATAPAVDDAIATFEAEHGVRVVVRPAKFGQIEEYMIADQAGSREIDVAHWHAFAAGALGHSQPVTALYRDTYEDDDFVPGAVEDVTWGGEIHGVPLDVNAMIMMVNTEALAEIGHDLDDLDTWAGVREVAEQLPDLGMQFTHVPASTWSMYSWVRANDADWYEPGTDTDPQYLFDSGPTVETFEFLSGLVRDGLAEPPDEIDSSSDGFALFRGGQTLAITTGTWDIARLQDVGTDFDWDVRAMPVGPSADGPGTVLGGSSLYVADQADDVDLAWEFISHLIQPEYALRYAREDGRLPAAVSVLDDPFFDDERYRVAVDQLPNAAAMKLLAFPREFDLATRAIYEVLQGDEDTDVAETFGQLQEQVDALEPAEET